MRTRFFSEDPDQQRSHCITALVCFSVYSSIQKAQVGLHSRPDLGLHCSPADSFTQSGARIKFKAQLRQYGMHANTAGALGMSTS